MVTRREGGTMREALSKRSSSQRPSSSTSRSAALKSSTSSKKKAASGRAHSRPLIQAKPKSKLSASKAAAKAGAASRSARGSLSAKAAAGSRPSKTARGKKPGKPSPASSNRALKSLRASRSSKLAKAKASSKALTGKTLTGKTLTRKTLTGKTLTAKKAAATKAARAIKVSRTRVKTTHISVRSRTRPPSSQKAAKAARSRIPAYVERVVPLDTPRRKPASGALKAFEHAVRVFNKRQFDEARELFDLVQHRFPQEVEIVARSQTYIQVCSQRMQRPPTSPRSADELYDRGVFHLNIGDFAQARQLFEKALRLSPGEPHLLYSLAASHAQSGSHEEALTFLDQLIQEHPRFRTQALNDSDFSELHENRRFLDILGVSSLLDIIDSRREP